MATPNRSEKKRPPHMDLRSNHPGQTVPDLAVFEQRMQEETVTEPLQCYELADGSSDSEMSYSLSPRLSNATTSKLSNKEAYSSLVNGVLRSPKKSRHSYASSSAPNRYSFTTPSKQSEQSYNAVAAAQMRLEGLGEETTARGAIEAHRERKYNTMMGQAPETPVNVTVTDLRLRKSPDLSRESGHQDSLIRSAKKKLLGVNLPFTRSAAKVATPPMPPKAAKLMGATPPERIRKYTPMVNILRADTSTTLPGASKLFSPPGHHGRRRSPPQERRRSPIHEETKPLSRARRRSPPTQPAIFSHEKTLAALTGSDEYETPPIPPRKDSLPSLWQHDREHHQKAEKLDDTGRDTRKVPMSVEELLRPPTPFLEPDDFTDSGMQVLTPPAFYLENVLQDSAKDTNEVHQTSASNKARLVAGPSIVSSYAAVRYSCAGGSEPSSRSPQLKSPDRGPLSFLRGDRQSAPPTPTVAARPRSQSPELEYLKPDVYVPPKTEVKKINHMRRDFELGSVASRSERGSIPIWFQGQLSEVDPNSALARKIQDTVEVREEVRKHLTSEANTGAGGSNVIERGMETLRITLPDEVHEPAQNTGQSNVQSEQSSSQPIISARPAHISPWIIDLRASGASQPGPSALGPGQQRSASHIPFVLPPSRGEVPLEHHFDMLHKHVEGLGLGLHNCVTQCQDQATKASSSRHENLKNAVEQHFHDIKSRIDSVGEKADDNGNQCHNLSVQLDKLRDFITAELAEFFTKQSQKTSEMEKDMEELKEAMQDLQKSFAQHASPSVASSPPANQAFPSYPRSQSNLQPFYESSGVANGLGRYGVNPQPGRQTYIRESRENAVNANMYQAAGVPSSNGYGAGSYPPSLFNGYYAAPDPAQSYGYGQGSQK